MLKLSRRAYPAARSRRIATALVGAERGHSGHLLGRFHGGVQHPCAPLRAGDGKEDRQRLWHRWATRRTPFPSACAWRADRHRHPCAPSAQRVHGSGVVRPESRVDLAESRIGVAVRQGTEARHIDVDALRRALLSASSIAYSASASGVYARPSSTKSSGSRRRRCRRAAAF